MIIPTQHKYLFCSFLFILGFGLFPRVSAQFTDPTQGGSGNSIPIPTQPQLFAPYTWVGNTTPGGSVNMDLGVGIGTSELDGKLSIVNYDRSVDNGLYLELGRVFQGETYGAVNRGMYTYLRTEEYKGSLYGNWVELDRYPSEGHTTVGMGAVMVNIGHPDGKTYGFYTQVSAVHDAYGGYFDVFSGRNEGNPVNVFGIYAEASQSFPNSIAFAGYFNGQVRASQFIQASDRKLKKNIRLSGSSLEKVMGLKVYHYDYAKDQYPHMVFPEGEQTGFIAQDVEEDFPQLVRDVVHPEVDTIHAPDEAYHPEVAYKGVDYTGMIPHLTKAIQEQQVMIQALQEEIKVLKEKLETESTVEVTEGKHFQLFQNIPNPAYDETKIAVYMGASYHTASIVIRDVKTGWLQAKMDIYDMGRLEFSIQTRNYPSGIYSYSLEVDGKIVESHMMVVE